MKSIRRQLTRELLIAMATLVGAGILALVMVVRIALVRGVDAGLKVRAASVAALTELEGGRIQFDFSADFLRTYAPGHEARYFEIWDGEGRVLARSPSLGTGGLPNERRRGRHSAGFDLDLPEGRPGRAVALGFTVRDGADARDLTVCVAVDRQDLDEQLRRLTLAMACVGLALIMAVLGIVPRLLRRGLTPIDALGAKVQEIDADSLAARFATADLPQELRPFADRLNDLLARLEASFERERRFSANLAHELRTPIAELRSLLECAIKWPDAREASTDAEALAIALQMESLVERMLSLARGERGTLAVRRESLDVARFVADAWAGYAGAAASRALSVTLSVDEDSLDADPVLFRAILANLFDNAVSYSPDKGEVRIEGRVTSAGYRLEVSNPAGALSQAEVPRLFERFWRAETARSGGRHLGLGLNLAESFAQAMGWRLSSRLDGGHRLVFVLEMKATA